MSTLKCLDQKKRLNLPLIDERKSFATESNPPNKSCTPDQANYLFEICLLIIPDPSTDYQSNYASENQKIQKSPDFYDNLFDPSQCRYEIFKNCVNLSIAPKCEKPFEWYKHYLEVSGSDDFSDFEKNCSEIVKKNNFGLKSENRDTNRVENTSSAVRKQSSFTFAFTVTLLVLVNIVV